MQKLTYINLLNESVVFANTAPFVFCSITGTGPVDIDTKELRGAYQHGATLTGWRRDKRDVTVTLHIQGRDRADMYRQRLSLSGMLSMERAMSGAERARIIYENDYGRWWTWAVPNGEIAWGKRLVNYTPSTKLRFTCECPWWFAMKEEAVTFRYSDSAFILPFSLPVQLGSRDFSAEAVNGGQTSAPVRIWIHGAGETPALVNRTTGADIRLTGPLPMGSVLHVNTDPDALEATLTDAAGETRNAFGLVDVSHPISLFDLRSGINEIVYEPGGDSSQTVIEMRWYDRFEGV